MVEGFSNAMQVEDNIVQLEACMRMIIEEGTGYASPYCWEAYAGNKSYGTFIITSVSVREELRDMSGNATRAFVDIELQEVPAYQVSSGTDITSTAAVGGFDPALEQQAKSEAAGQDAAVASAQGDGAGAGGADDTPEKEEFQAGTESYVDPTSRKAVAKPTTNRRGRKV